MENWKCLSGSVDEWWFRGGIKVYLIRLWPGVPHKKGCRPLPSRRCLHQSMLQYCHWNGTSDLHELHMLCNVQNQPCKEKSKYQRQQLLKSQTELCNHETHRYIHFNKYCHQRINPRDLLKMAAWAHMLIFLKTHQNDKEYIDTRKQGKMPLTDQNWGFSRICKRVFTCIGLTEKPNS